MRSRCPMCNRRWLLNGTCGHDDRRLAKLHSVGHTVAEIVAWRRHECPELTEQHVEDALRRVATKRTLPEAPK